MAKARSKATTSIAVSARDEPLETRKLLLDDQNPRLHPDERGASQTKLLEIMLQRFSIDEIAESVVSAGFLPLDPFVGWNNGRNVVVLEGNRRLAALKLLLDPSLAADRFRSKWDDYHKRLPKSTASQIERITVRIAKDRTQADVLSYIGFRHVNGVLEWNPEEKAGYIAMLVEQQGWTYDQVANTIGSKPHYVEKLYVAHRLVTQASDEDVPGSDSMRGQFGVLDRALQNPSIRGFLGVDFPRDPKKSRRPAKKSRRDLEDFVRWTFGTDETKPVLEDSRDLTKWGTVLSSADAVRYLRGAPEPRFDRAYAKSGGVREGLIESLAAAADLLEEAIPLIRQHVSDTQVRKAVERCTDRFAQVIHWFPAIAKQQGITVADAPTA